MHRRVKDPVTYMLRHFTSLHNIYKWVPGYMQINVTQNMLCTHADLVKRVHREEHNPGNIQSFNYFPGHSRLSRSAAATQTCDIRHRRMLAYMFECTHVIKKSLFCSKKKPVKLLVERPACESLLLLQAIIRKYRGRQKQRPELCER